MPRKPRNLKKTPKWMMPQHYAEYVRKAMAEEGHGTEKLHRPPAEFSRACLRNQHGMCRGKAEIEYSKKGPMEEAPECICYCHLELVE